MDFIDSLVLDDVNTKSIKKSHRVRSWLLCEQYYKYLEKSQVDASKQRKFYQDTILEHELCERRARRRVYEEGMCAGDAALPGADSRHCTATSFGSELECLQDDDSEVELSHYNQEKTELDSIPENGNEPRSFDETNEYEDVKSMSCTSRPSHSVANDDDTETVDSVPDSTRDGNTELKGKLENITNKIIDDIKLQMQDVEDNLQSLERYTELDGRGCDEESLASEPPRLKRCKGEDRKSDSSMHTMWARVVSFAYQLIQLNHGNCYYDYSAQFLTAVLAFDVLRRGFNKMCDILQPYVCPVKFACDQSQSVSWSENTECFVIRKKACVPRCCRKSSHFKQLPPYSLKKKNGLKCIRVCCTDVPSKPCCCGDGQADSKGWEVDSLARRIDQRTCLQSSKPWRNTDYSSTKHRTDKSYVQSQGNIGHHVCSCDQMWPGDRCDQKSVSCSCKSSQTVVPNPMLRIASHIDSLLKQIDDPGV